MSERWQEQSVLTAGKIIQHLGHMLAAVNYVEVNGVIHDVAIECEDCGEVIADFIRL